LKPAAWHVSGVHGGGEQELSATETPPHWLKPAPPQKAGAVQVPQDVLPPQPSALMPHV
jgi:hypothetical protein